MNKYELLEQIVVNLYDKNQLTTEALTIILEPFKDQQMETRNADPVVLDNGMTFDYILMLVYEPDLYFKLKKLSKGINDKFEELFYDDEFIDNYQRKTLGWW